MKLVIVQPYIPNYRLAFFEALIQQLQTWDVETVVACGRPGPGSLGRADEAPVSPWQVDLGPPRTLSLPTGVRFVRFGSRSEMLKADAVVVPLMGSCIDSLEALTLRPRRRVGLWGHVGAYVKAPSRADQAVERLMMRKADHVFAYTFSGANLARRLVPSWKVTQLDNAIERVERRRLIASDAPCRPRWDARLRSSSRLLWVGGLDHSKRVDLLKSFLDYSYIVGRDVHIVVVGDGEQRHVLERAAVRGQVTLLGHIPHRELGGVSEGCCAIFNPGRVGLTANLALDLGLPIITSSTSEHGPEVDFLEEGKSIFSVLPDAENFWAAIDRVTPLEPGVAPKLEDFVTNFAAGVMAMCGITSA